jgi:hypothetical protein
MYCPEISIEIGRAFGKETKLIPVVEPDMLYDPVAKESWIRFSVEREELNSHRLSAPNLIKSIVELPRFSGQSGSI